MTSIFWLGKVFWQNASGLPNILMGKSILGKYLWTAKVDDNLVKVLEVLHVTWIMAAEMQMQSTTPREKGRTHKIITTTKQRKSRQQQQNKGKVDNSIATWKSFLSENSRRRLCHRGCVVARIAEVAEYWWLIINEIINFQLKMENTKQNWNTQIHPHGPVHIGWGFLSHVPHAPQLVQTCVKKTKFNKGHFQRMRNHHVERKCPKDNFQRV